MGRTRIKKKEEEEEEEEEEEDVDDNEEEKKFQQNLSSWFTFDYTSKHCMQRRAR